MFLSYDQLLLRQGAPTVHMNALVRHFNAIEALIKGEPPTPVSIEIQPAGACNQQCRYCGFSEKRPAHNSLTLSTEEILQLISEIEDHNRKAITPVTEIKFNGIFSEPLATPASKATTIAGITRAVAGGFKVGLYTNGLGLDREVAEALVGDGERSAAFVNLSLDAGDWRTYRALKRANASDAQAAAEFTHIFENLRSLCELRKGKGPGPNIYTSVVLQTENSTSAEIEAMVRASSEAGADGLHIRCPYRRRSGAPEIDEIEGVYRTLARLRDKFGANGQFEISAVVPEVEAKDSISHLCEGSKQEKSYRMCYASLLRITVGPNGCFYPCDHRGYAGGGSLGHISEGFRSVIELMRRGQALSFDPSHDARCECCPHYDHALNELVERLRSDYANDHYLFERLKTRYAVYLADSRTTAIIGKWHGVLHRMKGSKGKRKLLTYVRSLLRSPALRRSYGRLEHKARPTEERLPVDIDYLAHELQQAAADRPAYTFGAFRANEPFIPRQFFNTALRSVGFLHGLSLAARTPEGRQVRFTQDGPVKALLVGSFPAQTPEPLAKRLLRLFDDLICIINACNDADSKDALLDLLPGYVTHKLSLINKPKKATEGVPWGAEKAFADFLLTAPIRMLEAEYSGSSQLIAKQLVVVLSEFREQVLEYAESAGFGDQFDSVILLSDAEPLAYPFHPPFTTRVPGMVHLMYFTRLSLLTAAEQSHYQAQELDRRSDYSRARFVATTALYKFLRGNAENRQGSAVSASVAGALEAAASWQYECMANVETRPVTDTAEANERELRNHLERVFLLSFAKRIQLASERNPDFRAPLERAYRSIPSTIREDSRRHVIFMDSGVHGSLPALLAALIYLREISAKSPAEKLRHIDVTLGDRPKLMAEPIRARLFLYAVDKEFTSVVPNSGFGRFGHGGANSFIDETVPKWCEFGGLLAGEGPVAKPTVGVERAQAALVLRDAANLWQASAKIHRAAGSTDLVRILRKRSLKGAAEYIFVDLDNVVFAPCGYLGSEQWYRDTHGTIPSPTASQRRALGRDNIRHDRRLFRSQCYDLVCDVVAAKAAIGGSATKLIAITNRQNSQRSVTEGILQQLGVLEAFDSIEYLHGIGSPKKDRVRSFLQEHGGAGSEFIFVDDALHNLLPLLSEPNACLIQVVHPTHNYRYHSGWDFFRMAVAAAEKGNRSRAAEFMRNAFGTAFCPLRAADVPLLSQLGGIGDKIGQSILRCLEGQMATLDGQVARRVEAFLLALFYLHVSPSFLLGLVNEVLGSRRRKSHPFLDLRATLRDISDNQYLYSEVLAAAKGIEDDGKTIFHFRKLPAIEEARLRELAKKDFVDELLESIDYPTLPLETRPYLRRIVEASLSALDIEFDYREPPAVSGIAREYVFDNHGNVIQQFRQVTESVRWAHTISTKRLFGVLDFLITRLSLVDPLDEIINSVPYVYRGPPMNQQLVESAVKTKRVPLEAVHDQRLRSFLRFLKAHNLSKVVVIGGGVRDALFLDAELADIDTALALSLENDERKELKGFFRPSTPRILDEAMQELNRMAEALGYAAEDFLVSPHNTEPYKPHFQDLEVSYVGPIVTESLDHNEDTTIVRILFDAETGEELSFNSGIGLLKLGLDMNGRLYGHTDSLQELLRGRARLYGDGMNFRLGEILRFLRLKHEFGLRIDALSYGIMHWRLQEYRQRRLTLPQKVLYDAKRQAKRLQTHALDNEASTDELNQLGIPEILAMSERGELEIDQVLTDRLTGLAARLREEGRKAKVLLINANLTAVRNFAVPVGLYSLRTALREFAETEAEVLDLGAGSPDPQGLDRQLLKTMQTFMPDLVGVSFTTPSWSNAQQVARLVRSAAGDVVLVAGGVHASAVPVRSILHGTDFDCVLRGEGEYSLPRLVDSLNRGESITDMLTIGGLVIEAHGQILQSGEPLSVPQVCDLPPPLLTPEELDRYDTWIVEPKRKAIPILASRGCPYNCVFCSKVFGHKVRYRSIAGIIGEIQYYYEIGWRNFTFIDDAFGVGPRRIAKLVDAIHESGLHISWRGTFRADALSLALLRRMKEAGCVSVAIGLESGSEHIRNDVVGKRTTRKANYEAVQWAKSAGIEEVKLFVTIGLPEETRDTVDETIAFVKAADPTNVGLAIATVFPGSRWRTQVDEYRTRLLPGHQMALPYVKDRNTGRYAEFEPRVWHETAELTASEIQDLFLHAKRELVDYLYDENAIRTKFVVERTRHFLRALVALGVDEFLLKTRGLSREQVRSRFPVLLQYVLEHYSEFRHLDREHRRETHLKFNTHDTEADHLLASLVLASSYATEAGITETDLLFQTGHVWFGDQNAGDQALEPLSADMRQFALLCLDRSALADEERQGHQYDEESASIIPPRMSCQWAQMMAERVSSDPKRDAPIGAYRRLVEQLAEDAEVADEAATLDIDVFYLHVTQYCDLSCRHCGGDAVPTSDIATVDPSLSLSWDHVERLIELLNTGYRGKVIVAGGGEPMLELPKILAVAQRSSCSSLTVVTNGSFGRDRTGACECLASLSRVVAQRAHKCHLAVTVCISVDEFHQEKLPIDAIKNVIEAYLELVSDGQVKPPEIRLRTIRGLDRPLSELAEMVGGHFEPAGLNEPEGRLTIGDGIVLPVEYALFMTKSARSKSVFAELPPLMIQGDVIPDEVEGPYRIGGGPGKLDVRVFEDGEVVLGREGHHILVIGHLDAPGLTIEQLKRRAIADPIAKALREQGLGFVLREAIAAVPAIEEEKEQVVRQQGSFLIERLLHAILKDDDRRLRITRRLVERCAPHLFPDRTVSPV